MRLAAKIKRLKTCIFEGQVVVRVVDETRVDGCHK